MPKLTIAIPTYNNELNIARAIKSCSFLNMNKNDYEILIVDNHSNDNSISIIKDLQKEFSNIRLIINKKNIGRIGNWNKAIQEAQGKYFIFLFSNEEINPENKIANLLEMLDKNEQIGLVLSRYIKQTEKEKSVQKTILKEGIITTKKLLEKSIEKAHFIFGPLQANIYRTKQFKNFSFSNNNDYTTDQITTIKYFSNFQSVYKSKNPQIIWHSTKNRFDNKRNDKEKIFSFINQEINLIKKTVNSKKINKTYFNFFIKTSLNNKLSINIICYLFKKIGFLKIIKGINLYPIQRFFRKNKI